MFKEVYDALELFKLGFLTKYELAQALTKACAPVLDEGPLKAGETCPHTGLRVPAAPDEVVGGIPAWFV